MIRRLAFAALVLLGACSSDDTPAGGCRFDTDCNAEQLCVETACVPATRFRCSGDLAPVVTASRSAVDFGEVGATRIVQSVAIENEGNCTLQIRRVEVRGDARFSCDACDPSEPPRDVPPDRSTSYEVAVSPGAAGEATGSLVFVTDDPERPELELALSATFEGRTLMRVSPLTVDFGYVPVGERATRVVQAINDADGTAELEIVNVYLDPSDGPFTVTPSPALPATLVAARVDPAARAAFTIDYAPTADAEQTATLRVVPRLGAPVEVALRGAGQPPRVTVAPTSIAFGDVRIGQTVGARIAVQNTGVAPLVATHAFASMGASGELFTPRSLPAALAPGAVFELDVLYTPSRVGVARDTMTILTNDPMNRSITIPVEGTGEASGQDIVRVDMAFDNDSDSRLDIDLRDVDLFLESPDGRIVGKAEPSPSWGMYGAPDWAASGAKENPERILLPDAMADGRFTVSISYVEDCKTLPTALTASLLGIGTDALVDYLSDGEVPLDPSAVAAAVQSACADRDDTDVELTVYVNGAPRGQQTVRLAQKGELVSPMTIVRSNGFFSVE